MTRTPTVRQAAILSGGLGTRLAELTASMPKPLLPCGDRPFIAWLMRELSRFGVEDIVLLTGHLGDVVEAALPAISVTLPKPLRIICSREEQPAGTGGALFHAREHLAERFLLCNGDSWLDFNLARLLADAASDPEEVIGHIALRRLDDVSRYGVVETTGGYVTKFHERSGSKQPGTINAGVYVFDRQILDAVTPVCSLERDVMPMLAERRALRSTLSGGWFIDIGVPADLELAQTEIPARLLRRALFLELDSVIDVDQKRDRILNHFTFLPGALATIRTASDCGWHVFVVTNQSGIAPSRYDKAQSMSLYAWMTDMIRTAGGTVDDVRYCPSRPGARLEPDKGISDQRKLESEMLLDLLARWQLDPARCLLIGNQTSDMAAAAAAGIPGHLFAGADLSEFATPLLTGTTTN